MPRRIKDFFFTVYFYTLFIIYSAVVIPALASFTVLAGVFGSKRFFMKCWRRSISRYGYGIANYLTYPFLRIEYKDESGENGEGPFVYIANHRSLSDPFLMAFLPVEAVQVIKDWVTRIPVLGWIALGAGYINISKLSFSELSEKVIGLFDQGVSIIVFPEGTRSGSTKMGPFHSFIFKIALKNNLSLVPLCIAGNENKPSPGSLFLHSGEIKIRRLESLKASSLNVDNAFQLKKKIREIIEERTKKLDESLKKNG